MATTVAELYARLFGEALNFGSTRERENPCEELRALPLASGCGEECEGVMRGAAAMLAPWGNEAPPGIKLGVLEALRRTLLLLYFS